MPKIDLAELAEFLARQPDVVFAVVFGSARNGVVAETSDLDLGILFEPPPPPGRLLDLMSQMADLTGVEALDYTDMARANPILAFEAISGRFLCKNSREKTAVYCARICREYEEVMVRIGLAA
jgi:predicted nucleotidyltransferase